MVQVLPQVERKRSFGSEFGAALGGGLGKGFGDAISKGIDEKKLNKSQEKENQAFKREFGMDISEFKDPETRAKIFGLAMEGKLSDQQYGKKLAGEKEIQKQKYDLEQRNKSGDLESDKKRVETIKQHFGEKAAAIYEAAPEGGKTQIINTLLEARQRGMDIDQLLSGVEPKPAETQVQPEQTPIDQKPTAKNKPIIKPTVGLTPKEQAKRQTEYLKVNEPKVAELADTERKLVQEEARYNRMEELFQNPENFPSSFTAALFTKDGNINDIVYSQLTPDAQEAIKLIIDSTSNIKDTYGARVTNFDLQTYLKKLPSLLNSPEGKMRVIRDLKIINQLNQLHARGIQEIFDEVGGTDQIPFSTAEKHYKERYGDLEKELLQNFVTPDKGIFKERPEPSKFLGKKIQDEETGEIFISDGNEWKPFEG